MAGTIRKSYKGPQQHIIDGFCSLRRPSPKKLMLELRAEESSFQTKGRASARLLARSSVGMREGKNVSVTECRKSQGV